jgi:hypothetical protein
MLTGENGEKNMFKWHFVYHKSYTDWPEIGTVPAPRGLRLTARLFLLTDRLFLF